MSFFRVKTVLFIFCIAHLLMGCATTHLQSKQLIQNPPDVKPVHVIEGVPFYSQKTHECGPTSLAMVLRYFKKNVEIDLLSSQILTGSKAGSLQSNMVGGARRNGLMSIALSGFNDLLKEIDAGNPVIVFENLALSWWPQWHYAVVYGYDLQTQELYMHSGPEQAQKISFLDFERDWSLAKYWGLVVFPPNKLSATANELAHINSAAILESLQKTSEATVAYQTILKKWPQSLGAHIGLANIEFASGRYQASVDLLSKASKIDPTSKTVQHNIEVARNKLKQTRK